MTTLYALKASNGDLGTFFVGTFESLCNHFESISCFGTTIHDLVLSLNNHSKTNKIPYNYEIVNLPETELKSMLYWYGV